MKVGLITTEFLPVRGGVGSYCVNLSESISNKVELHVFTTSRKDVKYTNEILENLDNINVHIISSAHDVFLSSLKFQLILEKKLPKLIDSLKLDIIHSAAAHADFLSRIKRFDIPNVLTCHSIVQGHINGILDSKVNFKNLHSSEKMALALYPLLKLYEYEYIKKTDNIIAVSHMTKNNIIENYKFKGNIFEIPNGVNVNLFKPEKKEGDRLKLLFSGRMTAIKGIQNVIKSIPNVLKERKDVLFVFAGVGNKNLFIKMLNKLNIPEDKYEFTYISNYYTLPRLYNSCDILLNPSLYDNFPMSVLEAMACGLPVVASDIGDIPLLVKDNVTGYLINKGDYKELSCKINLLLDDDTLRKKMSKNARTLIINNYSAEIMGKKTVEVYDRVLEERK